jgi:hypothetical protein
MQDGWTPVVLSIGGLHCLLWMDETGRVSELRELESGFVEPVCVIDVSTKTLRREADALHFDIYEQNKVRIRWRLSTGATAGTVTKKIIFREKRGIDIYLGTLRLPLRHVTWDLKEFSPGLFNVKFHGLMMIGNLPLVYEKAAGMIYSNHEWNKRLIPEQNRIRTTKSPVLVTLISAGIPPQERAALIALYNSTDGDSWYNNSGWKTPPLAGDGFALPGTENTWYGITCDPGNTTVQSIYMEYENLNGDLPPELGNLANLQTLTLGFNQLSGTIPPELGNLANLKSLVLYGSYLSGSIPPELGNLANLQYLCLESNWLSGSIPQELGNLANLKGLHFHNNQLSGSIPPELGKLANLQGLELYYNGLSGSIPPELGNLDNLYELWLNYNQLSGSIPPELGNLDNLQYLFLDSNWLSGSIPSQLGNLDNLLQLWLNSNQLSGSIPPELGNLANLITLFLNSNQLRGGIPSNLTNLTNLWDGYSDLRWNALYTNDDILRAFLDSKQEGGDWESNQTIAPPDVAAFAVSTSSIAVNWTPIAYTSDTGGYRVYYSTVHGGPYTYFGMTADKTASSLTVTGLNPGVTYYFVVQTRTNSHTDNQNTVDSEYSSEVSLSPLMLTSPNGGESWGLSTIRDITWTSLGLSGNIRLELWKADKKLGAIAANIPIGNGSYAWSVGNYGPGIASPGNDYKVKIITANGLYKDTCDATFSILQPSLTLAAPHGGENWKLGTLQDITWTSLGLTGNVRLLLFKDGAQVGVIVRGIPIANGTYAWTVGRHSMGMAPVGSNYTVKIRSEDNRLYNSGSGAFTIQ